VKRQTSITTSITPKEYTRQPVAKLFIFLMIENQFWCHQWPRSAGLRLGSQSGPKGGGERFGIGWHFHYQILVAPITTWVAMVTILAADITTWVAMVTILAAAINADITTWVAMATILAASISADITTWVAMVAM
jgi:hypothetical protein